MNANVVVGIGKHLRERKPLQGGTIRARARAALPRTMRATGRRREGRSSRRDSRRRIGLRDFVQSDGSPGYFQQHYCVYDRAALPCRICGPRSGFVADGAAPQATSARPARRSEAAAYLCPLPTFAARARARARTNLLSSRPVRRFPHHGGGDEQILFAGSETEIRHPIEVSVHTCHLDSYSKSDYRTQAAQDDLRLLFANKSISRPRKPSTFTLL